MVLLSFPQHKRSKCRDRNGQFVKFYSALLKHLLYRSGSPYSDLKGKIERLTLLFTLLSRHSIDFTQEHCTFYKHSFSVVFQVHYDDTVKQFSKLLPVNMQRYLHI